jgi:hypothetical protein
VSVPLSPAAQTLIQIFEAEGRALSIEELRARLVEAGEASSLLTSALAECTLRQLVHRVPTWSGSAGPIYYELVPTER